MPIYAQSSTLRSLLIPLVDIDQTTVANEDVLQYNATTGKFENQSLTSLGLTLISGAANVGTGETLFKDLTTGTLNFKSIIAGAGVTLTDNGDDITVDVSAVAINGSNVGTGEEVFKTKNGNTLEFRKVATAAAGQHFAVATVGDTIEFKNTAEVNTASNLGAGSSLFAQKTGEDLQFKSIVGGTNITVTNDANTVTIAASATAETATSFQFTVAFDGNGNLQSVSDLPAGWTSTVVGNKLTVVHTSASMVKNISYWGKDAVNGWQLRFPNAGFQATIPVGNETDTFILDINASVAGADASSTAKVNVIF
jgi:hypothetical protein